MSRTSISPDNDAIRELRDEVKDLNKTIKEEIKSNGQFSKAFIAFGIVQIAIALFQFGFDATDGGEWNMKSVLAIFVLLFIGWMFWYMLKDIPDTEKK